MSDDDSLSNARNKTLVFSLEERKLLLLLVNKHYEVVNNRKVDSKSTNQKYKAWEAIHEEFGKSKFASSARTSQQLKRCWENMRCKAKKGDRTAQRLLRWADNRYRLSQKNGDAHATDDISETIPYEDGSDSSIENLGCINELDEANNLCEERLQQLEKTLNNESNQLEKVEKLARFEMLKLEKQQKDKLFVIKVQRFKEKEKREKELHRLAVHEMTLRVENERRKAEILERELGHQ